MAGIERDIIDAIRDRTDVVDVVGQHVKLTRKGSNWVGLCPFHQEKSASFYVVPSKAIYHCFGCNAGGDVFRFLMQIEGLSFFEAVKTLASSAGIALPTASAEARRATRQRATLYEVIEQACCFFESQLWTEPQGEQARTYLQHRGLTRETSLRARIGWAPGGWTRLVDHLHSLGISENLVVQAGLARRSDTGRVYDVFRERVVIPIQDERERVIAFGGRLLEGDGPKYINSPDSPVYRKGQVLYGLHTARKAIGRLDHCLVVEGYFDVLSLHQAGFEEAVATCGTALTNQHVHRIRRFTRNIVVVLDSDEAGSRAAAQALPLLLEAGLNPWRLQLQGAKDPDELIQQGGPEAMTAALQRKEPLLEWVVQHKLLHVGRSATGRNQVVEDILPLLKHCPSDVVSRAAARLRIDERVLLERLRTWTPDKRATAPKQSTSLPPSAWKPDRDTNHLLWLLVHRYDQVADVIAAANPQCIPDDHPLKPIIANLTVGESLAALLTETTDPQVSQVLCAVAAKEKLYTPEQAALGACQVLARLANPLRERVLAKMSTQLDEALRLEDHDTVAKIIRSRRKLIGLRKETEIAVLTGNISEYIVLSQQENALHAQEIDL